MRNSLFPRKQYICQSYKSYRRKSYINKNNLMGLLICILFMLIMNGFNIDNADYVAGYYEPYYDLSSNYFEWGYKTLNYIGNYFGLSFFVFRFFFVTVTLLLTIKAVFKYSRTPLFIICLYLLYPFLLTVVQIRNAFATSIVMCGIGYLNDDDSKGVLKYIFIVLLATLFHKICIFYLLLIIVYKRSPKQIIRFSLILFFLLYIAICCYADEILQIAYGIIKDGRILYYVDNGGQHYFVKSMLPYIAVWILLLYLFVSRIKNREYVIDPRDLLLYKSSLSLMGMLPLFIIDGNYFRVWAFFLPIIYTSIANISFYRSRVSKDTFFIILSCILMSVGLYAIQLGPYDMKSFENVTKAIFSNNVILDYLFKKV